MILFLYAWHYSVSDVHNQDRMDDSSSDVKTSHALSDGLWCSFIILGTTDAGRKVNDQRYFLVSLISILQHLIKGVPTHHYSLVISFIIMENVYSYLFCAYNYL